MRETSAPISEIIFAHAPLDEWEAPRLRTMREFAAEEIELSDGEYVGEAFDPTFQRWVGLLLDMFDLAEFVEYWISGPRQTGKTLVTLIIPLMYHLFARRENCIMLAPTDKIAWGVFDEKVLPTILKSGFGHLMPTTGLGSKGGAVAFIKFKNGATLRFFGAGKHAASTFTARCIFVTEASKMEAAAAADGEADPISAVIECASSFDRHVVYSDCIMTGKGGIVDAKINDEGTASKVTLPCPHCGVFQFPERDRFKGWESALDVVEAKETGAYHCINCAALWSETERLDAIDRADIVHEGELISKRGKRSGKRRRTDVMGLQWNALCSALRSQPKIAAQEWNSARSGNAKKEQALCNYVWALPYTADSTDLTEIDAETIAGKMIALRKGVVPEWAEVVVVTVDVGGHRKGCHWIAGAFHGRRIGHVFDYGVFFPGANSEDAIEAALLEFWQTTCREGWEMGGKPRLPDVLLIDSGWKPQAIYNACAAIGATAKAIKGYSRHGEGGRETYVPKQRGRRVPRVGDQWHESRPAGSTRKLIHIDADYYKRRAQECFTIESGKPGSLTLFNVNPGYHMRGIDGKGMGFARHMVAEIEMVSNVPGRGEVREWQSVHRANDWLDTCGYLLCGADLMGMTIAAPIDEPRKKRSLKDRRKDQRQSRRRGSHR